MSHESRNQEQERMIEEQGDPDARKMTGAPPGARQNVRLDAEQSVSTRPGGATQNSGGAIESNDEESGLGPGRGAD
jgi:hypothetical protein